VILASTLLLAALVVPARADRNASMRAEYDHAIRQLDREEFLEDEPIWLCAASIDLGNSGLLARHGFRLVGTAWTGARVRKSFGAPLPVDQPSSQVPRAFEFGMTFGFTDPGGRFPLMGWSVNGIPAGRWQVFPSSGDTARALAAFTVVPPIGSERSVRDGLARAARLASGVAPDSARSAALYEAIYQRYPRTAYLSVLYWGEWGVRAHTRFAQDPGRWLEEIFAHFHDSCFGVVALDQWVRDMGEEAARPTIRRLVGIYPDTPLSRAAARYL
jgi:hypothetical protein